MIKSLTLSILAVLMACSPERRGVASAPPMISIGDSFEAAKSRLSQAGAKDISMYVGIRGPIKSELSWWELPDGRCVVIFGNSDKGSHIPIDSMQILPNGYSKEEFLENRIAVESVSLASLKPRAKAGQVVSPNGT